ncbi:hypothetical protein AGABI2DRAFT_122093 [Agaricus bisporus var. bisporus H97]|uniref:hypothetical protein n=1 Tax=Agaricus bisporus var. bisporus (strain H97 / ATCC MYA-4626 / FGSC 10389) TaxID=936046 RepID=UPI00029F69F1|nr:hypothetical protein AGABI2DRAFT_122093 [Agaricus bisporus var. bisporus H97]EKV43182.1 hypothetical protein AGABI2DRAFT_122093 [Agaricus bisporus var. bisporus H97]
MDPKASRDLPSRIGKSSRYIPNRALSSNHQSRSPASTSTSSSSSFTFTTASDSDRRGTPDSTPLSSYVLDGSGGTSSWQVSSNDYRNRQSRPSNSANGKTISAPDCDRFFNLLEKASARINDNIRNDTNASREFSKRITPLKSTASVPKAYVKRINRTGHSGSGLGAASEGITKGKARDLATLTNAPKDVSGRSARIAKSLSLQQDHIGATMDLDPPRPSLEVMPPPPVPLLQKKYSAVSPTEDISRPDSPFDSPKPSIPQPSASSKSSPTAPFSNFQNPHEQLTQTQNACPTSSTITPGPTPKLHSLLDPERRQRRLKLKRTISASLAPFSSSGSSSDLGSSTRTTVPTNAPSPRIRTSHQTNTHPLSQDDPSTRPPPLGMRRTNTFPLLTQKSSETSNRNVKVAKPAKQKFKPPLLSTTQSPPTNVSSRSNHPSSNRTSSSSKTSREASHCKDAPNRIDEDMDEDLPSNSEADFSFGESVNFDIDMDALEETMRKYD